MGRPFRALAAALGAALLGVGPAAVPAAGASGPHGQPTLTLVSQTPWVGPGQPMVLHLQVSGTVLSSLNLTVTVYEHLTSRSAFAETAAGTAVGRVLATATVPTSTLASGPPGQLTVTVPVATGDAPATGSGPLTANLACQPGNCGGVYPLRLQLSSSGGGAGSSLFTYLVYANPPVTTNKVRLAWILPLALPTSSAKAPSPDTSSSSLAQLLAQLQAVGTHPSDGLSLQPVPATVAALSGSQRPTARSALAALQALSAQPAHQVLSGPFVPVDATALASAGLQGELAEQLHRGAQVLTSLHAAGGVWRASGPLDQAALSELASLGFDRVVVPPGDVSSVEGPGLTATAPFVLSAGRGVSPTAVESDSQLAADLASASGTTDALAAYRMLADLALVYYEEPNDSAARGVVLDTAPGTAPDAATLDVVLGALQSDPLVTPVTIDQLFSEVPLAPGLRRLSSASSTSSVPGRRIRSDRSRLSAFASALDAAATPVVHALGDRLLWSENEQLHPGQQLQALRSFEGALGTQLSQLSIRADTIKLTSTAAKVPLTLTKQSAYSVSGTFEVSGDKVVFPSGTGQDPGPVCHSFSVHSSTERSTFTCQATIALATNAVYVDMRARVAGDFRLTVTFTSPTGGLVLASTHITVHSMSTSLVAVALSAAALLVLLWWWGRTLWRRHPAGRGAHVRGRTPGPPVGVS